MNAAQRLSQILLIASVAALSWLGMMGIHEVGHVGGARWTGATVERVVLHPLTISSTDLSANPRPLFVAWSGPIGGVLIPLVAWAAARSLRCERAYLLQFFLGFCLVANGAYIGGGSFARIGDCGDLLRHGAALWQLWLFGGVAVALGIGFWNGLGPRFGLGAAKGKVDRPVAWICTAAAVVVVTILLILD
jgi:hypothetical protein